MKVWLRGRGELMSCCSSVPLRLNEADSAAALGDARLSEPPWRWHSKLTAYKIFDLLVNTLRDVARDSTTRNISQVEVLLA